ncbi:MAG TPA: hypothetical protein VG223_15525 [Solirubrobacteraceae bacterium]|jgi:hypothetical protein|nr:hypothetical protein [Solirubrobacteraceae bacterium]
MPARSGVLLAVVCAAVVAGCGTSDRSLVQSKVEQLQSATAHHAFRTLCTQVLAPSLLAHLTDYGIPCEKAMQLGLGHVTQPALAIGRIEVHGDTASVDTITTAKGQEASLDAIELVKTSAGWRVSSLGTPTVPK